MQLDFQDHPEVQEIQVHKELQAFLDKLEGQDFEVHQVIPVHRELLVFQDHEDSQEAQVKFTYFIFLMVHIRRYQNETC